MRKFIVSDLHGDGNVYNSIMSYIDNIKKNEDVILYINGDLIDRGPDAARMLLDVKRRIENNENIVYLGGNHELMMHQMFKRRKQERYTDDHWYSNGGKHTDKGLWNILNGDKDKIFEVADYVSDLNVYHVLDEKVNGRNILLVHAASPYEIKYDCDLKIKDDNELVDACVWTRIDYPRLCFKNRVGDDDFLTIIGHTPVDEPCGYKYFKYDNYMNIDGGCSVYLYNFGNNGFDHVPLVEVNDGYLKILTFNNNNEIIMGHYFSDYVSVPMNERDLNEERALLNKDVKIKKLTYDEWGMLAYKD